MCKWLEDRPNDWTYQLKCPKCGEELDKPNYHIDKEELQKTKEEIKSHIASLIDELMQR